MRLWPILLHRRLRAQARSHQSLAPERFLLNGHVMSVLSSTSHLLCNVKRALSSDRWTLGPAYNVAKLECRMIFGLAVFVVLSRRIDFGVINEYQSAN